MLGGLATTVTPHRAPADLTAKFREQLAQVESTSAVKTALPDPLRLVPPPAPNPKKILPFGRYRLRQSERIATMVAVACITFAALVLVAMGAMAINRMNEDRVAHEEMERIMRNSDTHRVQLQPMEGASGKVMLYMLPDSSKAVLVAELPPLPDEQSYQLWLMKPNERQSAMVFKSGQRVEMLISMPEPLGDYMATGITVEPKQGSSTPTTNPIFMAKFEE
jgi:hypothetical protein